MSTKYKYSVCVRMFLPRSSAGSQALFALVFVPMAACHTAIMTVRSSPSLGVSGSVCLVHPDWAPGIESQGLPSGGTAHARSLLPTFLSDWPARLSVIRRAQNRGTLRFVPRGDGCPCLVDKWRECRWGLSVPGSSLRSVTLSPSVGGAVVPGQLAQPTAA